MNLSRVLRPAILMSIVAMIAAYMLATAASHAISHTAIILAGK